MKKSKMPLRTVIVYLYTILLILQIQSFADPITLEEIIVSGEREINPEDRIDIKEVRETSARDVGEALKSVEGVSAIRKGTIANDITIRGFQKDNLTVLIDGMMIHGACPNRMDPSSFHVDFAEVEEISVQKGPFDVKNPGGLGGIIDIRTIKPEKGLNGGINTFIGSYKNISTSAKASYGNEEMDALLGYSYKYSLPYRDGDGKRITQQYPLSSTNRYRDEEEDDKAYSIMTYWIKFGFNLPYNQRIAISYSRQEANDIIYPYLLMDAVFDDTDRLNLTYQISELCEWIRKVEAQFYFNEVEHDMTDSRRVSSVSWPSGYMMKTKAETETYGGKIGFELQLYTGTMTIGIDYYMRNWNTETTLPTGTQNSIPNVDISNVGTFIEYTQPIRKIALIIGARFNQTKSEAHNDRTPLYTQYHENASREETDSYGDGNIQVTYKMTKRIELFSGLGHATRVPDPVERYFALEKPMTNPNWVGNPKLDNVKNREVDFGIKFIEDLFFCKAVVFYSDVKDYITIFNITGVNKNAKSYRNIDATLYGGELSSTIYLPFHLDLQWGLSYSLGRDDTYEKPLFETPPITSRIALRWEMDDYFTEIESLISDDQDRIDSDLNEEKTPGWSIFNIKIGMKYRMFNLFAGIQNIFDRQYYEHLSYQRDPFRTGIRVPEIGRNYYFFLAYSF
ncbi:MAG: TonB-dependent receptor [Spirochaetota bacterium]|nr:TonB-dependent receptor [Spirochaetota bacterium]